MKGIKISTFFVLALLASSTLPVITTSNYDAIAISESSTTTTESDIEAAIEAAEIALVRCADAPNSAIEYVESRITEAKGVLESGLEHYGATDLDETVAALKDATIVLYYCAGLNPNTGNKMVLKSNTANSNATNVAATPAVAVKVEVVNSSDTESAINSDSATVALANTANNTPESDADIEVPATATPEEKTVFDVKLALAVLVGVFVFSVIFGIIASKNAKKGYRRA